MKHVSNLQDLHSQDQRALSGPEVVITEGSKS